LDEREKYWISYYNSYKDGYNSTLGGRLVELYNFDEEEIIECYMELKSARKVAKEYGVDHNTIDNILNVNNINRFTVKKKTKINKGGMEIEFDSVIDAARYFIETGVSKAKSPRVLFPHLLKVCQNNKTYFGWTVEIEQE
jgi:abortive infection bacteriophage resistance protein